MYEGTGAVAEGDQEPESTEYEHSAKPAEGQKMATILGVSLKKQSESKKREFVWESDLPPLTSIGPAVQASAV